MRTPFYRLQRSSAQRLPRQPYPENAPQPFLPLNVKFRINMPVKIFNLNGTATEGIVEKICANGELLVRIMSNHLFKVDARTTVPL